MTMLTKTELNRKIAGIATSTASLRLNIQTVLINAAGQAYEHGDVTYFTKLIAATSGMNRTLIAKWVHDYGFARMNDAGVFKLNKAARKDADFAHGDAVVDYLKANARDWFVGEADASGIAKELNVASRIESLAKSIAKAQAEGKRDVIIDTFAVRKSINDLQEVLASIRTGREEGNNADTSAVEAPAPLLLGHTA